MKKAHVLSAILCLFLLPLFSLAEDASPAYHSAFELSLALHADAYPEPSQRLRDWEVFLGKLNLKGYLNAMEFPNPFDRVYLNASLYVDGMNRIPFVYDHYYSFRYLTGPLLRGESLHFQMHNFFDFMYKAFDYWRLPANLLAIPLYPEATWYIADRYYAPLAEVFTGEENRTVPYEDLLALAEELNLIMTDDAYYERGYLYFTILLAGLEPIEADGEEWVVSEYIVEKLSSLETLLDDLDPDREGMTVAMQNDHAAFILGDRTVFEQRREGGANSWELDVQWLDGFQIACAYEWMPSPEGASLGMSLKAGWDDGWLVCLSVEGAGLPCADVLSGSGTITITITIQAGDETLPFGGWTNRFAVNWSLDSPELPLLARVDMDWLHPHTLLPAVSLRYEAEWRQAEPDVFVEGHYPQIDFFSLNEASLAEYKERYLPSLVLAFAPLAMEMTPGVINDIYDFLSQTGIILTMVE